MFEEATNAADTVKREPAEMASERKSPPVASLSSSENDKALLSTGKRETPAAQSHPKCATRYTEENIQTTTEGSSKAGGGGPFEDGGGVSTDDSRGTMMLEDRRNVTFQKEEDSDLLKVVRSMEERKKEAEGEEEEEDIFFPAEIFDANASPSEKANQASVMWGVIELTPHDVLLARRYGRYYQHYAGNLKLTKLIRQECENYRTSSFKNKADMIPAIVRQAKQWNPRGRFLRLNPVTTEWIEVPDDHANLHVLQLFLGILPAEKQEPYVDGANQEESGSIEDEPRMTVWDLDDCDPEAGDDGFVAKSNLLDPKLFNALSNLRYASASLGAEDEAAGAAATADMPNRSFEPPVSGDVLIANRNAAAASLEAESVAVDVEVKAAAGATAAVFQAELFGPQQTYHCDITFTIIQKMIQGLYDEASDDYIKNKVVITDARKQLISIQAHRHFEEDLVPVLFPDLPPPTRRFDRPAKPADNWPLPEQSRPARAKQNSDASQIRICSDNDVLWGNGFCFRGNLNYQKNVEGMKAEYASCGTWSRKTEISRTLVRHWRSRDPPGRFLERDGFGFWKEMGDAAARRTTCHLLCNKEPEQYSEPEHMRPTGRPAGAPAGAPANVLTNHERDECARLQSLRDGYNEAVVDVALYNYECFHGAKHGSVCFGIVAATSAGIDGWAAACIQEKDSQPKCEDRKSQEEEGPPEPDQQKRRTDPDEARQLQIALLESVGACPRRLVSNFGCSSDSSICSEGEWSAEYDYYDDDDDDDDDKDDEFECAEEEEEEVDEDNLDTKEATELKYMKRSIDCETMSGPRTLVKSSWQFQQLMNQIQRRGVREGQVATVTGVTNDNPRLAQAPCSSDEESWSQVSSGASDSSGAVLVVHEDDEGSSKEEEKPGGDWQQVGTYSGTPESEDDWSDVSNAEHSQKRALGFNANPTQPATGGSV